MTFHQSAYNHPSPQQTITALNQVALHHDPEPFEQDTIVSYSANPEEILMAKEALLSGMSSDYCDYFGKEINEESDCYFDGIAPTVNNLTKENK